MKTVQIPYALFEKIKIHLDITGDKYTAQGNAAEALYKEIIALTDTSKSWNISNNLKDVIQGK